MFMNAMRAISAVIVFGAAAVSNGQSANQAVIDVSRDGVIENFYPPQPLVNPILTAVESSQRSSQENPEDRWYEVFMEPNWIHVRFAPPVRA